MAHLASSVSSSPLLPPALVNPQDQKTSVTLIDRLATLPRSSAKPLGDHSVEVLFSEIAAILARKPMPQRIQDDFIEAIKSSNTARINEILDEYPDAMTNSPLVYSAVETAVENNQLQSFNALKHLLLNTRYKTSLGISLKRAAQKGFFEIVESLIQTPHAKFRVEELSSAYHFCPVATQAKFPPKLRTEAEKYRRAATFKTSAVIPGAAALFAPLALPMFFARPLIGRHVTLQEGFKHVGLYLAKAAGAAVLASLMGAALCLLIQKIKTNLPLRQLLTISSDGNKIVTND